MKRNCTNDDDQVVYSRDGQVKKAKSMNVNMVMDQQQPKQVQSVRDFNAVQQQTQSPVKGILVHSPSPSVNSKQHTTNSVASSRKSSISIPSKNLTTKQLKQTTQPTRGCPKSGSTSTVVESQSNARSTTNKSQSQSKIITSLPRMEKINVGKSLPGGQKSSKSVTYSQSNVRSTTNKSQSQTKITTTLPRREKINVGKSKPASSQVKRKVDWKDLDSDSVWSILDFYGGMATSSCGKLNLRTAKYQIIGRKFMKTYYGRFKDGSLRFLFNYLGIERSVLESLLPTLTLDEMVSLISLPIVNAGKCPEKFRMKRNLLSNQLLFICSSDDVHMERVLSKIQDYLASIVEIDFYYGREFRKYNVLEVFLKNCTNLQVLKIGKISSKLGNISNSLSTLWYDSIIDANTASLLSNLENLWIGKLCWYDYLPI